GIDQRHRTARTLRPKLVCELTFYLGHHTDFVDRPCGAHRVRQMRTNGLAAAVEPATLPP
ncbi:MAG TPA: hypothetical protein VNQ33_10425, partial [Acidimicrobiales bacterium]|nr:hypothetical protein [Acidimicrobiales bacterium]